MNETLYVHRDPLKQRGLERDAQSIHGGFDRLQALLGVAEGLVQRVLPGRGNLNQKVGKQTDGSSSSV